MHPLKTLTYLGLSLLSLVLALLSTTWAEPGDSQAPATYHVALGLSAIVISTMLLLLVLLNFREFFRIATPGPTTGKRVWSVPSLFNRFFRIAHSPPGNRWQSYQRLVSCLPELGGYVTSLKAYVRQGDLPPGSPLFEKQIREMHHEFPTFVRIYTIKESCNFVTGIVLISLVIILSFAALNLSACTLSSSCIFAEPYLSSRSLFGRALDSTYYSTITFCSVGYGDFAPEHSDIGKVLSTLEAFSFIFTIAILFNFVLALTQSQELLTADDLTHAMRTDMERPLQGINR